MEFHGVIHEPIQPNTGFFGGVAGELPILVADGNWESYLPVFETQNKNGLETMNCVQYSRLNACEIQANFYGKPVNFSDRGLGWASGCTPQGNTYSACTYWLQHRGACLDSLWPWTVENTWNEYYQEPPQAVQDAMSKLFDDWVIGLPVYVPTSVQALQEALKRGPIWFCNQGHSMVIYRVDTELHVFDSYANMGDGKRSFPLEYVNQIVSAYLVPFTPKEIAPKPMIKLPANSLVVVVDGHGERLMNVDGTKLYQDDAGKIGLEVQARNTKPGVNGTYFSAPYPIVHVTTKDIEGIPRVNLKGQPV